MNKKIALFALTGSLTLAACGGTPAPTNCNSTQVLDNGVCVTAGSVTVPSNPNGYTLTIRDAAGNVIPASQYSTLKPGIYTATYSKDGYVSQSQNFTVTAGQPATLNYPTLQPVATPVTPAVGSAYYVNASGQMVAFTKEQLDNAAQNFVFYAWLENEDAGVNPVDLAAGAAPTQGEQYEVAPLGTQNLTGAFVGFRAPDGNIYPVVGAGVRWDIAQATNQTNVRFATADDGAKEPGTTPQYVTNQAMTAQTFTNSATNPSNARFPSSQQYPLNNATGVGTPDTNGFTWTALWVPDGTAGQATVTAVAEINGTEINKTVLTKIFAPSAKLEIVKDVTNGNVGLNQDGTFSVTVRNVGAGPAANIRLNDVLQGGANDAYSITPAAGTTANAEDGFTATFDLQPGEERTFTFPARSSAVGVYCDVASIVSYDNGPFGTVTPSNLRDDACLTVTAPQLNIVKTLVDANGNVIGAANEVARDQAVYARITVTNGGNAAANNVVVTDRLVSGNAANYAISGAVVAAPQQVAVTDNAGDGFTTAAFDLAAGASQTFTFPAVATADGRYCDAADMTATSNNGAALAGTSQEVCFTVVSPNVTINKFNTVRDGQAAQDMSLLPGGQYDSVITLTNSGTGAAAGVAVSDLLGNLAPADTINTGDIVMSFGSGSFTTTNGQRGSLVRNGNTVTTVPERITLAPGETMTVRLTSTVPAGTPAGTYCDFASFTSTNAGTGNAEDCITVRNIIAVATAMTDNVDPVTRGQQFVMTSSIAVEQGSNQAAINNVVSFNFGSTDPRAAAPGVYNLDATEVRYNPAPARDPKTGAIVEPQSFDNARVLVEGVDYTVSTNDSNQQVLTFTDSIGVGGIVYFRHTLNVPAGTADGAYNSGFVWSYTGANSGATGLTSSTESTTVYTP